MNIWCRLLTSIHLLPIRNMCRYSYILFFLLTSSGAYGFTSTNSPRNNLQRTNGFTSKTVKQKPSARTHDFALNAILEAGIDPLTTTAIFAAAFFILSAGQTEVVTSEDIKMGKERLKDLAENEEKNTKIDKALEKTDLIDDSVKIVMEDMITSFQNSPIQSRSRPAAISFDPDISSLKRRVASTLKSEMAMKERLGEEHEEIMQEILMQEPGPQKPIPKPKVVEPILAAFLEEEEEIEEKVEKSPVMARIVKKLVMPWKKFSTLS